MKLRVGRAANPTPRTGSRCETNQHSNFLEKTVSEKMIAAFGRIRFTSMNLTDVLETQPLLNACAETLQTLRLRLGGPFDFCKRFLKRIL